MDEVKSLLQAAVDKYDSEEKFSVELTHDAQKEFNVLTTEVVNQSGTDRTGRAEGRSHLCRWCTDSPESGRRSGRSTGRKGFRGLRAGLDDYGFCGEGRDRGDLSSGEAC